MTPPRRNVELKARDTDPAATLERALALGATDEGVLTQRDTYVAGKPTKGQRFTQGKLTTEIVYAKGKRIEER